MCGVECANFAHSHIVPRAFTPKNDVGRREVIAAGGDGLYKKRPNGIWDETILCNACEKRLGKYDQYAVDVFRDKKNAKWLMCFDGLRIAYFPAVNRRLLRGFLASLLWRFSVSQVEECKKVFIGAAYEERIAHDLFYDGSFSYIDSLVFVLKNSILTHMIATPVKKHFKVKGGERVNGYSLNLPGLAFYTSLDQRKHPLVGGPSVFDCGGEKIVGTLSLAECLEDYPYVIPDIGKDEEAIAEILPVVASHKKNKDHWFAALRQGCD